MHRFLQLREVPHEMQHRVHAYLDEIWSLKQGVAEKCLSQRYDLYNSLSLSLYLSPSLSLSCYRVHAYLDEIWKLKQG